MSLDIVIVTPQGSRRLSVDDLPLRIGSAAQAEIRVPGAVSALPVATIGALDGRPFLQPAGSPANLRVNDEPVLATRWLADADVIGVDSVRLQVSLAEQCWTFSLRYADDEYQTLPPELPGADDAGGEAIAPVQRQRATPAAAASAPAATRTARRVRLVVFTALALLLAVVVFLFTARAVRLELEPSAAEAQIAGGLFKLRFGDRYLMWPGDYRVLLKAEGYVPAREEIRVSSEASQSFSFALQKLPGQLVVSTRQGVTAKLWIDGAELGITSGEPLELTAGEHLLRLEAERYLPFEARIDVEGLGRRQLFEADLAPGWAEVTLASDPPGATISDGELTLGVTPAMIELMAGSHELRLQQDGYKIWRKLVNVSAGEVLELPPVELQQADGLLVVTSDPPGAAVSIDRRYRGTTPVDVELAPGRSYSVIVSQPGYGTVTREVRMAGRQGQSLNVRLEPRVGEVKIVTRPADAEVLLDGKSIGSGDQQLSLPARSHRIEVRRDGYATYSAEVTPKPGLPQLLEVELLTEAQAVLAATPLTLTTGQGAVLRLVEPGSLRMGAPRREQGRRPNETERQVRLTRRFYIGIREVTNTEFREFSPQHTSGAETYRELAVGDHPVVMLSWEQAVSYCNWLSDREGLPRAYVVTDGRFALASPRTSGYRLPTEAEWAWVARYNAGGKVLKYPWGDVMPPTPGAGNYADRSARGIVANVLENYEDGFPVTAPVGRFAASPLGLFDLGGNAAEWVNDLYGVQSGSAGDAVDPVGPAEGQYHVIRGSGWRHASISELRFAARDFGDRGRLDVGFRLARYADDATAKE